MPFFRFYSQNKCNFTGFKETGDRYARRSIKSLAEIGSGFMGLVFAFFFSRLIFNTLIDLLWQVLNFSEMKNEKK